MVDGAQGRKPGDSQQPGMQGAPGLVDTPHAEKAMHPNPAGPQLLCSGPFQTSPGGPLHLAVYLCPFNCPWQ